ncbi:MAG TPA: ATP-binding protein, partial [Spirochaetia bacterium]|nr:ATP-binding protein [Spirochaetia bacterium]
MVYCYAELRNYRQLLRLRASSLPVIESGFASSLGSRKVALVPLGQGAWITEMGPEDDLDASSVAAILLRTLDFLEARRAELFGFAILVAGASEKAPGPAAERLRGLLLDIDREEGLWCTPECARLLSDHLAFDHSAPLHRVTGPNQTPDVELAPAVEPRPWIREALIARALDVIGDRLNTGESREVLHLHGPSGSGKSALLREVSRRLLGTSREITVLHPHTLFKRRSPLHPFLNSLSPALISAVPRHLLGVERAAWAETAPLLSWLLGTE